MRDARHLARLLHLGEIVAVDGAQRGAGGGAGSGAGPGGRPRGSDVGAAPVVEAVAAPGIVYYGGKPWTGTHDLWLRAQRRARCSPPGLGLAFDIAYDTVLATVARRDRLDAAITAMAAGSEFTPVVTRLGCLRGVSTLTAFGLAVEIGDWHRLTGRSIGAYLGLVPTESSSGASRSQGSITKTGNGHARRLLIEAAWHHRPPYRIGADLRRRQDAADPAARDRGAAGQPAPARPLGSLRRPPQAAGGRQHRDRPRAGRLVLVTGRPRLNRAWPRASVDDRLSPLVGVNIVRPRSADAALRALHVDPSHAPRRIARTEKRGP